MSRTFKRIALVLLGLLALLAIFHRPLLFRLTRYFIARAAEQQKLSLSYEISGSIFTNLRITKLTATPKESGPVEQLEIGSLRLSYSLWGLLRKGLPGFLESAALVDATIVIDPSKSMPPAKAQKKQSIKFPALIPEILMQPMRSRSATMPTNYPPPGPNNPVGIIWMQLNRDGIGLHGTGDPETIGRASSHGCIRPANWDALDLAKKVLPGVKVTIR